MSITHITDHYEQAVDRLPMVYRDKPRYLAWLASYCAKIQEIEDVSWEVFVDRLLQNNPTGDLLAKLGQIVGQANLTGVDAEYRLLIQARILSNRSDGRRRDLTRVTQALWPLAEQPEVWVFDMVPATVLLIPQAAVQLNPYVMYSEIIAPAVGAGIHLLFIWTMVDIGATLILDDSAGSLTLSPDQYLSDSAGAFTGGVLAGTV